MVRFGSTGWRRRIAALLGTLVTLAAGLLVLPAMRAGAGPAAGTGLAATLTVCPHGCMYSSIETALENSAYGDTVQVGPGEYHEFIWLRGGVRVQGAGAGKSFILWSGTEPAVVGYPHDLTGAVLDGFTIVCNSANSAIHLDFPHEKEIISNNVISNSVGQWHSGGIYIASGATPQILDNTFVGNTLSEGDGGGAIFVKDAAPIIRGNTFINNSAKNGGAIAVYKGDDATYWGFEATISYNTFVGNQAAGRGGAIHIDGKSPIIRDNRIENNGAVTGGGICATGRGDAVIQGNEIASNSAGGSGSAGGGVYVSGAGGLLLDSNVIRDNSSGQGSAIYAENAGLDITNNVLRDNGGAQIVLNGASPGIANNTILGPGGANSVGIDLVGWSNALIVNNLIAGHGYGIRGDGAAGPTIRYNDLWQNAVHYSGVAAGPGNLTVSPGLRDADSGDVHLLPGAALIDAGTEDGAPAHDYEGDTRPMDGDGDGSAEPDIGADEYYGSAPARTRTPTSTATEVQTPTPTLTKVQTPTRTPTGMLTFTPTPSSTQGAVATATRTGVPTETPTAGPTANPSSMQQEAEQGALEPPMAVSQDAAASGGLYVSSPVAYEGQVSFQFYLQGEADYELWGRVAADSYGSDSFLVTVDDGAEATWDLPIGGWSWVAVTHRESGDEEVRQVYRLAPGRHEVVVHTREAGARLDVVELRMVIHPPEPSATPTSTRGAVATATATVTATPVPTPTATATATPVPTATPTPSSTRGAVATLTPAPTATPTLMATGTATPTPTSTGGAVATATATPVPVFRIALPLVLQAPGAETPD